MYQEDSSFDQTNLHGGGLIQADDGFSQTHIPNCSNNHSPSMEEQSYPEQQFAVAVAAASTLEMELHRHLQMEQSYNAKNGEPILNDQRWQEINGENQFHHQIYNSGMLTDNQYSTTPDLLNMNPLPRCSSSSLLPNSTNINFSNRSPSFLASLGVLGETNSAVEGVVYDPLLPLNLSPQPPYFKELFTNGGYAGPRNGSLFSENGPGLNEGRGFDNGVFELTSGEMDCINGKNRDGKDVKHFANEKHRRVLMNDKFQALRNLVPHPTKSDRASIVGEAIEYIKELKRTVSELNVLVEQKRCAKERLKRPKTEDAVEGNESKADLDNGSSLRSSWLHRKSKNSEVDVRIIDDEVTVKLVQQKRINCLLFVSRALDDLQLDLHHVAGGLIGDYYSYLFNSKICEGSIVYASAVANKLIEVVDKQYAAIPPTNSY